MAAAGGPGSASVDPLCAGTLAADREAATSRLLELVDRIDQLPPAAVRDAEERRRAEELLRRARSLRRRFLARHVEQVYAELTDGLTRHPRLERLAALAAERFPGLVPGPERLAAEGALRQSDKEGWEVDLGIFFHAVFSSRAAGSHLLRTMLRPTPAALAALPEYRRTGRADLKVATVTRQDGVASLELCNDAYLNAEDDAAVEALETGTDLVLLDEASHVGVLRGAAMSHAAYRGQRVFSAGINLTHLYHGRISFLGFFLRREAGYINKFVKGLCLDEAADDRWGPEADKPWVAAVDSFAIGGGMQILPTMDRVVAADDAWFSLPAMEEGLIPGLANLRLPGLTGGRLARDLILWGRRLRAGDPAAALVCDEAVPADRMDGAVRRAAEHLANPAVPANRRALGLAEEPFDLFRHYMAVYALEQSRRLYSADLVANLERTWISRAAGRTEGGRR
ncbi:enoyl-CoA hydratase/isomerase family protein [Streptomyces durbertensis]|uniref:Enoyl-CoA hydratase/isomerase family protein n=2 Tax=Streptomyces durbertensis TaxID=2448886 RepID=A0ABR6EGS9_9ACTN|nr:enoyl-CoA hydratase/isomerase family protein [Streptomyces durbertensis]